MPKTLVVADDSQTIREFVRLTFLGTEFDVIGAKTAAEARALAAESSPAVILADLQMPDTDGYTLCAALRGDPATSQVPVLLIGSPPDPYDPTRAESAGASGHLPKPFDTERLLEQVGMLTGTKLDATLPMSFQARLKQSPASATDDFGLRGPSEPPQPPKPTLPPPPPVAPIPPVAVAPIESAPADSVAPPPVEESLAAQISVDVAGDAGDTGDDADDFEVVEQPSIAPSDDLPIEAPVPIDAPFGNSGDLPQDVYTSANPAAVHTPPPLPRSASSATAPVHLDHGSAPSAPPDLQFDAAVEDEDEEELPRGPSLEPPPPPGAEPDAAALGVDVWAFADAEEAEPAKPSPEPEPEPVAPSAPPHGSVPPPEQLVQTIAEGVATPIADAVMETLPAAMPSEELRAIAKRTIEEVAWEVVPELAETIIRQELDRLLAK